MLRVSIFWILTICCLQKVLSESVDRNREMNITDKCECGKVNSPKIINGQLAKPHAYPWMVAIFYNNRFDCGGSLINDRYVLTAGHCVDRRDKNNLIAILGLHDQSSFGNGSIKNDYVREIKRIVLHHDYFANEYYEYQYPENDIALIELKEPVGQLLNVGHICLPLDEKGNVIIQAIVSGWGLTEEGYTSQFLRETAITILSEDQCLRGIVGLFMTKDMLCGLGMNDSATWKGDSGGPLFVEKSDRYEQIGIVSWGMVACLPHVYAKVSDFTDWIVANTQNAVYCA